MPGRKEIEEQSEKRTAETVSSKEMLEVFAKTGHETLKAILIISAGSVVVLLPFFGSIICSDHFVPTEGTVLGLAKSFQTFIRSLVFCLCCYAAAFLSHACYYYRWRKLGLALTLLAAAFGVLSIAQIGIGGGQGYSGLKALVAARATASQALDTATLKPDPGLAPSEGTNQRAPGIAPASPR